MYLMISCLDLVSSVLFGKFGMFWGPVAMASQISRGVASMRLGAYLPSESAPPRPAKLWHWAQLVRNSTPPVARSASLVSRSDAVGMAGPGPSEATNAASAATCSSV